MDRSHYSTNGFRHQSNDSPYGVPNDNQIVYPRSMSQPPNYPHPNQYHPNQYHHSAYHHRQNESVFGTNNTTHYTPSQYEHYRNVNDRFDVNTPPPQASDHHYGYPPSQSEQQSQSSMRAETPVQLNVASLKEMLLSVLDQKLQILTSKIESHGTVIQGLVESVNCLKEKELESSTITLDSRVINNNRYQQVPTKQRGGRRGDMSPEKPERPKYHPYIPADGDSRSVKKNSRYPNVTLGYQFVSIEICNQWIKAQVCYHCISFMCISFHNDSNNKIFLETKEIEEVSE